MKKIIPFITAIVLIATSVESRAYEIAILQGSGAPQYRQCVSGFKEAAAGSIAVHGVKSVSPDTFTTYYLDQETGSRDLGRILTAAGPDLILALGDRALDTAIRTDNIPVIFLLAPSGTNRAGERPGITGISMIIPPSRQLEAFNKALPETKRIGLLYDPARSEEFVEEAGKAALLHGMELVVEKVGYDRQVPDLLNRMAGRIDAFWMLPDPTVINSSTVEAMVNFSMGYRIPLLAFADKYVDTGATAAVTFDLEAMGKQAALLARKVLESPGTRIAPEPPSQLKLRMNSRVAAKIGVVIDTAMADIN